MRAALQARGLAGLGSKGRGRFMIVGWRILEFCC
jgi:hypothetical protein